MLSRGPEKITLGEEQRRFHWRDSLPAAEIERIPPVFRKVLDRAERRMRELSNREFDLERMAVVISAYDAKELLPQTLREISQQMKALGLKGEIFVVLNNGGGNTAELFRQEDIQPTHFGVDEIFFARTQRCPEGKDSRKTPRPIEVDGEEEKIMAGDGIRLIVIEQAVEEGNEGKIRALRDVYHWLGKMAEKGYSPYFLLAMDAETRLRRVGKNGIIEINSPFGLQSMIEKINEGVDMVGARLHFVPYGEGGNPMWSADVPPAQKLFNVIHGKEGFQWLFGGATLGKFPQMVAILETISQLLPGTRFEDVLTTLVARIFGKKTVVLTDIVHTNRCPAERKSAEQQIERWWAGIEGIKKVAGESLAGLIIKSDLWQIIFDSLLPLVRKQINSKDAIRLIEGLLSHLRIGKNVKPDDFESGTASW